MYHAYIFFSLCENLVPPKSFPLFFFFFFFWDFLIYIGDTVWFGSVGSSLTRVMYFGGSLVMYDFRVIFEIVFQMLI